VLVNDGVGFAFHRSSFRDFFAGHHIFRHLDLDEFALSSLMRREWGSPIVFAAGLRRANSGLLSRWAGEIDRRFNVGEHEPTDDELFATYVLGRVLSNSESSDHGARLAALRAVVVGARLAIPGFERMVVEQYGKIGHLLALLGAEHSLFVTLGVPWLRRQIRELLEDSATHDDERFLLGSVYAQLGFTDAYDVLLGAVRSTSSTRVVVALDVLVRQLSSVRTVRGAEKESLDELQSIIRRKLSRRKEEVKDILSLRDPALEVERKRLRRVMGARKRGKG
jgi:hypothetical protein